MKSNQMILPSQLSQYFRGGGSIRFLVPLVSSFVELGCAGACNGLASDD